MVISCVFARSRTFFAWGELFISRRAFAPRSKASGSKPTPEFDDEALLSHSATLRDAAADRRSTNQLLMDFMLVAHPTYSILTKPKSLPLRPWPLQSSNARRTPLAISAAGMDPGALKAAEISLTKSQ